MGASELPGTTYIPSLRENLRGFFTINIGVYVPEVARYYGGGEAKSWIQEYHCCVWVRLSDAYGKEKDIWWPVRSDDAVIIDVRRCLELGGIPFLERYSTRDKKISEWSDRSENIGASSPPRIVMAIIFVERGEIDRARELLARWVLEARNQGHVEHVRKLAKELELGCLDG